MKSQRRVVLAACGLVCLLIGLGVLFWKRDEAPAPRVQFLGFTYASNSSPTALFSVTNDALLPQMVSFWAEWEDSGIHRPAMSGKKQIAARFVSPPLPVGGGTNFFMPVPSPNVAWFVNVYSAPAHSEIEGALGRISKFMRSIGIEVYWGLKPMRPSGEKVVVPKYEEGRSD